MAKQQVNVALWCPLSDSEESVVIRNLLADAYRRGFVADYVTWSTVLDNPDDQGNALSLSQIAQRLERLGGDGHGKRGNVCSDRL